MDERRRPNPRYRVAGVRELARSDGDCGTLKTAIREEKSRWSGNELIRLGEERAAGVKSKAGAETEGNRQG